jgi:hypothetical protein
LTINDRSDGEAFWKTRVGTLSKDAGLDFDQFDSSRCLDSVWCHEPQTPIFGGDSKMGKPRAERSVVADVGGVAFVH